MGFLWSERESQWQRMFNRLEAYLYQHGTLDVDRDQSPILWAWVDQQRKNYQKGKVPEERIALLEAIGFVFDLHEASWSLQFEKLQRFYKKYGHAMAPTKNKDDPSFGHWIAQQR